MPYRKLVPRYLTAAAVLVLSASTSAAAPLPPLGGVRVDALSHSARSPLRAGDRLIVTLRGTAGGSAVAHIFGVASDIRMRSVRAGSYQAQPAVYAAVYTVRPGDAARNARILATLTVGGRSTTAIAPRPLTIDTKPPAVAGRYPAPGSTLTNIRPNIVARFGDEVSGVDSASGRLLVNGRNVTARATVSGSGITYNPAAPLPPGRVHVQLDVADRSRNTRRAVWAFNVSRRGPARRLIDSVTLNPATPLIPGDLLTVVMTGVPGGQAAFSIGGIPGSVPMRESGRSGVYFGTLAVRPGQLILDAPVAVTHRAAGRSETAAASVGVTILGTSSPPPVAATSPPASRVQAGTTTTAVAMRLGTRLVVRGRSMAGFRILARVVRAADRSTPQEAVLGEFSTLTGADGAWELTVDPIAPISEGRLSLRLVVIDPAGRESVPSTVDVGG